MREAIIEVMFWLCVVGGLVVIIFQEEEEND